MEYEAVIGLEVHVQLNTKSKMFTSCPHNFGEDPNSMTDAVIWALPGVLPVLNFEAIRKTIKVGMLLKCRIPEITKWDRKNYFYPDSAKNYQLSQYDEPLCIGGEVEIELAGANRAEMGDHKNIKLTRIHLEEDVGKLTHFASESLIDYNRAGTPLIEIVSEPDMHSGDEAFAYLVSLKNTLVFAGVSGCDMEKGQMRCDANISIRPKGEKELGVKVELKNLNSISGVKNGIEYEIKRQIDCVRKGVKIIQETRRWDAQLNVSQSMRGKEQAHDYRYFPEPDLMPVKISKELLEEIGRELPELPFEMQRRYNDRYSLPYSITSVLCCDMELSKFFESTILLHDNPKAIANIIVNDLLRELSSNSEFGEGRLSLSESKVTAEALAELVRLTDEGKISKQIGKEVFVEMFKTGKLPSEIIAERGLIQNSDSGELEKFCLDAMEKNAKAIEQFKGGNEKAINALIGPIMKASQGKANPAMVLEILRKLINR